MDSTSGGGSQGSSESGKKRGTGRQGRSGGSGATRSRARAGRRPKGRSDPSVAEPATTATDAGTTPATDEALAAINARRALSPDMPRVAWIRAQLQNLEAHRRERLTRAFQLTLIALVFMVFVLQNAEAVPVKFLLFSVNIRLIWVIVGAGLLGGMAGYVVGRPEKVLKALTAAKGQRRAPGGGPAQAGTHR